jgi:Phage integrase family/PIN like domain
MKRLPQETLNGTITRSPALRPLTLDRQTAVHLHGKGRKQRAIPLWKNTATKLRGWLNRINSAPDTPVFPHRAGAPLTRSGVRDRLNRAVATAEQRCPSLRGQHVSPHTLRHSTAMHLGHPHLPEILLGTIDVGWMPIVAKRNGVAIRRDRRIHTRPLEVRVFSEVGLRTVWLGGKKDMGSRQQLDLVTRHWQTSEISSARVDTVNLPHRRKPGRPGCLDRPVHASG